MNLRVRTDTRRKSSRMKSTNPNDALQYLTRFKTRSLDQIITEITTDSSNPKTIKLTHQKDLLLDEQLTDKSECVNHLTRYKVGSLNPQNNETTAKSPTSKSSVNPNQKGLLVDDVSAEASEFLKYLTRFKTRSIDQMKNETTLTSADTRASVLTQQNSFLNDEARPKTIDRVSHVCSSKKIRHKISENAEYYNRRTKIKHRNGFRSRRSHHKFQEYSKNNHLRTKTKYTKRLCDDDITSAFKRLNSNSTLATRPYSLGVKDPKETVISNPYFLDTKLIKKAIVLCEKLTNIPQTTKSSTSCALSGSDELKATETSSSECLTKSIPTNVFHGDLYTDSDGDKTPEYPLPKGSLFATPAYERILRTTVVGFDHKDKTHESNNTSLLVTGASHELLSQTSPNKCIRTIEDVSTFDSQQSDNVQYTSTLLSPTHEREIHENGEMGNDESGARHPIKIKICVKNQKDFLDDVNFCSKTTTGLKDNLLKNIGAKKILSDESCISMNAFISESGFPVKRITQNDFKSNVIKQSIDVCRQEHFDINKKIAVYDSRTNATGSMLHKNYIFFKSKRLNLCALCYMRWKRISAFNLLVDFENLFDAFRSVEKLLIKTNHFHYVGCKENCFTNDKITTAHYDASLSVRALTEQIYKTSFMIDMHPQVKRFTMEQPPYLISIPSNNDDYVPGSHTNEETQMPFLLYEDISEDEDHDHSYDKMTSDQTLPRTESQINKSEIDISVKDALSAIQLEDGVCQVNDMFQTSQQDTDITEANHESSGKSNILTNSKNDDTIRGLNKSCHTSSDRDDHSKSSDIMSCNDEDAASILISIREQARTFDKCSDQTSNCLSYVKDNNFIEAPQTQHIETTDLDLEYQSSPETYSSVSKTQIFCEVENLVTKPYSPCLQTIKNAYIDNFLTQECIDFVGSKLSGNIENDCGNLQHQHENEKLPTKAENKIRNNYQEKRKDYSYEDIKKSDTEIKKNHTETLSSDKDNKTKTKVSKRYRLGRQKCRGFKKQGGDKRSTLLKSLNHSLVIRARKKREYSAAFKKANENMGRPIPWIFKSKKFLNTLACNIPSYLARGICKSLHYSNQQPQTSHPGHSQREVYFEGDARHQKKNNTTVPSEESICSGAASNFQRTSQPVTKPISEETRTLDAISSIEETVNLKETVGSKEQSISKGRSTSEQTLFSKELSLNEKPLTSYCGSSLDKTIVFKETALQERINLSKVTTIYREKSLSEGTLHPIKTPISEIPSRSEQYSVSERTSVAERTSLSNAILHPEGTTPSEANLISGIILPLKGTSPPDKSSLNEEAAVPEGKIISEVVTVPGKATSSEGNSTSEKTLLIKETFSSGETSFTSLFYEEETFSKEISQSEVNRKLSSESTKTESNICNVLSNETPELEPLGRNNNAHIMNQATIKQSHFKIDELILNHSIKEEPFNDFHNENVRKCINVSQSAGLELETNKDSSKSIINHLTDSPVCENALYSNAIQRTENTKQFKTKETNYIYYMDVTQQTPGVVAFNKNKLSNNTQGDASEENVTINTCRSLNVHGDSGIQSMLPSKRKHESTTICNDNNPKDQQLLMNSTRKNKTVRTDNSEKKLKIPPKSINTSHSLSKDIEPAKQSCPKDIKKGVINSVPLARDLLKDLTLTEDNTPTTTTITHNANVTGSSDVSMVIRSHDLDCNALANTSNITELDVISSNSLGPVAHFPAYTKECHLSNPAKSERGFSRPNNIIAEPLIMATEKNNISDNIEKDTEIKGKININEGCSKYPKPTKVKEVPKQRRTRAPKKTLPATTEVSTLKTTTPPLQRSKNERFLVPKTCQYPSPQPHSDTTLGSVYLKFSSGINNAPSYDNTNHTLSSNNINLMPSNNNAYFVPNNVSFNIAPSNDNVAPRNNNCNFVKNNNNFKFVLIESNTNHVLSSNNANLALSNNNTNLPLNNYNIEPNSEKDHIQKSSSTQSKLSRQTLQLSNIPTPQPTFSKHSNSRQPVFTNLKRSTVPKTIDRSLSLSSNASIPSSDSITQKNKTSREYSQIEYSKPFCLYSNNEETATNRGINLNLSQSCPQTDPPNNNTIPLDLSTKCKKSPEYDISGMLLRPPPPLLLVAQFITPFVNQHPKSNFNVVSEENNTTNGPQNTKLRHTARGVPKIQSTTSKSVIKTPIPASTEVSNNTIGARAHFTYDSLTIAPVPVIAERIAKWQPKRKVRMATETSTTGTSIPESQETSSTLYSNPIDTKGFIAACNTKFNEHSKLAKYYQQKEKDKTQSILPSLRKVENPSLISTPKVVELTSGSTAPNDTYTRRCLESSLPLHVEPVITALHTPTVTHHLYKSSSMSRPMQTVNSCPVMPKHVPSVVSSASMPRYVQPVQHSSSIKNYHIQPVYCSDAISKQIQPVMSSLSIHKHIEPENKSLSVSKHMEPLNSSSLMPKHVEPLKSSTQMPIHVEQMNSSTIMSKHFEPVNNSTLKSKPVKPLNSPTTLPLHVGPLSSYTSMPKHVESVNIPKPTQEPLQSVNSSPSVPKDAVSIHGSISKDYETVSSILTTNGISLENISAVDIKNKPSFHSDKNSNSFGRIDSAKPTSEICTLSDFSLDNPSMLSGTEINTIEAIISKRTEEQNLILGSEKGKQFTQVEQIQQSLPSLEIVSESDTSVTCENTNISDNSQYTVTCANLNRPTRRTSALPVQDFFSSTPKENSYSALMMAAIASKNKPQHTTLHTDHINELDPSTIFIQQPVPEINGCKIDLTEVDDECTIVRVSSKNDETEVIVIDDSSNDSEKDDNPCKVCVSMSNLQSHSCATCYAACHSQPEPALNKHKTSTPSTNSSTVSDLLEISLQLSDGVDCLSRNVFSLAKSMKIHNNESEIRDKGCEIVIAPSPNTSVSGKVTISQANSNSSMVKANHSGNNSCNPLMPNSTLENLTENIGMPDPLPVVDLGPLTPPTNIARNSSDNCLQFSGIDYLPVFSVTKSKNKENLPNTCASNISPGKVTIDVNSSKSSVVKASHSCNNSSNLLMKNNQLEKISVDSGMKDLLSEEGAISYTDQEKDDKTSEPKEKVQIPPPCIPKSNYPDKAEMCSTGENSTSPFCEEHIHNASGQVITEEKIDKDDMSRRRKQGAKRKHSLGKNFQNVQLMVKEDACKSTPPKKVCSSVLERTKINNLTTESQNITSNKTNPTNTLGDLNNQWKQNNLSFENIRELSPDSIKSLPGSGLSSPNVLEPISQEMSIQTTFSKSETLHT